MLEKFTVTGPTLLNVSVNGLLVCGMLVFGKGTLFAENLRANPTPVKLTVVGLLGSESKTVKPPFLVPEAIGVKVENTWQLLNPGIDVPQVELGRYWLKSEPE